MRFCRAAMELFRARGYADTTVPQIAAAAGLTERTFYRYFPDKQEVLFWRAAAFEAEVIEGIRGASIAPPLDMVIDALEMAGRFFDENRTDVLARQAIVAAHAGFQERELAKMASLAVGITKALLGRGVSEPSARISAEAGVTLWRIAIENWRQDPVAGFAHHLRSCLKDLTAVLAR